MTKKDSMKKRDLLEAFDDLCKAVNHTGKKEIVGELKKHKTAWKKLKDALEKKQPSIDEVLKLWKALEGSCIQSIDSLKEILGSAELAKSENGRGASVSSTSSGDDSDSSNSSSSSESESDASSSSHSQKEKASKTVTAVTKKAQSSSSSSEASTENSTSGSTSSSDSDSDSESESSADDSEMEVDPPKQEQEKTAIVERKASLSPTKVSKGKPILATLRFNKRSTKESSSSSDSDDSEADAQAVSAVVRTVDNPASSVSSTVSSEVVAKLKLSTSISESNSESSSSSESSNEDSEVTKPAPLTSNAVAEPKSSSTASTSPPLKADASDSDSDSSNSDSDSSSSESESDTEKERKDAKLKKPSVRGSSSSSDTESDSESDSSSESDSEKAPPAKRRKMGDAKASAVVSVIDEAKQKEVTPSTIDGPPVASSSRDSPLSGTLTTTDTSNGLKRDGRGKQPRKNNTPFQRIKPAAVEFADERLKDNSFTARGAKGGDYGERAHNDLIVTRGAGFRKEKNKKKRGSYRGGDITLESHSIKFT